MTPGQQAVAAVPRPPFIPDLIYVPDPDTGWLVPLSRADDPEAWGTRVERSGPVVTAVAPDPRAPAHVLDPVTGRGYESVSSSTDPALMAHMIDALDLAPGIRILEIGTGTGWNAAVLASIVGAGNVVSVELDPQVADRARVALTAAGYPVRVVVADGTSGCPEHAPFDRVVATAAVREYPQAWIHQTRPGGCVLVPWDEGVRAGAPLTRVQVSAGGVREEVVGSAPFMAMRATKGT